MAGTAMAGVTVDAVTITDGAAAADITMDGAITGIITNRTAAGEKSAAAPNDWRGAWLREAAASALVDSQFDGDADQVRVILRPELLLQQRRRVGHRLVGNFQRVGDLGDLVAAAEQPQDF